LLGEKLNAAQDREDHHSPDPVFLTIRSAGAFLLELPPGLPVSSLLASRGPQRTFSVRVASKLLRQLRQVWLSGRTSAGCGIEKLSQGEVSRTRIFGWGQLSLLRSCLFRPARLGEYL